MIKPRCVGCSQELNEYGAILLSPPENDVGYDVVKKYHLCKRCYQKVINILTCSTDNY